MSTRGEEKVTRAYRRILWPTDFSPLAAAALPHALKLAADSGAELVVLHVLPLAALFAIPEMMGAAWEQLDRENRAMGKAELHRVTEQLQGKAPKLRVHSVLAKGVPFDQILRVAQRLRCDLIVRPRTGAPRSLSTTLRH